MIRFNKKIVKKVKKKERDTNYFDRCLDTFTCSKCGGKLKHSITDDENTPDELYECIKCKFSYTMP